jgi:hypothetical protein
MFMRRRNSLLAAAVAAIACLVLASVASAQSLARLRGTVTDEQGAVVADAQILLRNQATGQERSTVSDKAGEYQLASLPVGAYTLEVKANGFQTRTLRDIRLEVAQTAVQNVRLSIGGVAEELSVVGEAPVIESTTTSVGQVINQRTVQEIPLNGRHFVDLGLLIPGSVAPQPATGFLTAPLRGQGSFAFNTAGNREDTVNFQINGINLNDQVQNQITFQPSINTVQEFKVDNQTLSAEYGRSSGAVVNIATRSGSNEFHGEAFEFYRNQSLDARNFFNAESQPQSPFERNQFGANLGGPIIKNKTFFFVSYEGLRQRQQLDFNSGVLSDAQRDAVTDPVVRNLLPLIPEANATAANGQPRFVGTGTAPVNIDQWTGDLSHQLGQDDRFHGYYAFQRDERGEPNLQGNTIPGFGDTRSSHRQILTLNETHIFSPSLVNEARFGFNRIDITFAPNAALSPADYGINNGITAPVLPQITIQGIGLNFGGPSNFPQGRTDTTFVLADSVTYQNGRHSFKFGGEYRRFHNVNFQTNGGTFNYPSLAAFQAGQASSFTATLGDIDSDVTQNAVGFFAQDSFRVRSNVTLELGVRYDLNMSPTEADDRFVYFDPASASLYQVGQGPRDKIYENKSNFEPRVGVVWDPGNDGRTAIRAAYALTTDQPVTNLVSATAANPPLVTPLTFTGPIRLDNAIDVAGPAGLAPTSVDAGFRNPRIQTWNVNVQRELWKDFSVMLGYFGSKGDHLRVLRNANQIVNGVRPYPQLAADSPIRPGATLGNVLEGTSLGRSRYDGLWVTLNKRFSGGLQFNGSYTLSKSKDTNSISSQGAVGLQDSNDVGGDFALSDYDARHRYVLSGLWELPFKGNQLKEGWQISVITQGQSGNPVNVVTNLGNTGVINSVRPDLVGSLDILGTPDLWFSNTVCDPRITGSCTSSSVFALPFSPTGAFHLGNLGRNVVIGPGFFNTDMSIIKRTRVGQATIEFRAEAFNVFNHPNLGQPGRIATVGSTSLGVITGTRLPTGDSGSARQIQFALKLIF